MTTTAFAKTAGHPSTATKSGLWKGSIRRAAAITLATVALTLGMATGVPAEPARTTATTALVVPPAGTAMSAKAPVALVSDVRIRRLDGAFRRV